MVGLKGLPVVAVNWTWRLETGRSVVRCRPALDALDSQDCHPPAPTRRIETGGFPASYRWRAQGLPLDGLELALPRKGASKVSTDVSLERAPWACALEMAGAITLDQPGLLGLQLRQARIEGTYRNRVTS